MQLMVNIAPTTSYSGVRVFRDALKGSLWLQSNLPNTVFTTNGAATPAFDAQGHPITLSGTYYSNHVGQYAVYSIAGVAGVQGTFTFHADQGSGYFQIRLTYADSPNATITSAWTAAGGASPTNYQFTAARPLAGLSISTCATDDTMPGGHLTGLKVMMPDPNNPGSSYSPSDPTLWHDDYLSEFLLPGGKRFDSIRLMDLQGINGSNLTNWSDVFLSTSGPLPYTFLNGYKGIPWDVQLGLASTLQVPGIWACVPHLATDAFVASFAAFLRDNWPGTAYIEYSNEVWNSSFAQYRYACDQGFSLYAPAGTVRNASNEFGYGMQWYGLRAYQVQQIFRSVFASDPNPSRYKSLVSVVQTSVGINQFLASSGNVPPDYISVNGYYGGELCADAQCLAQGTAYTLSRLGQGGTSVTSLAAGWRGTAALAARIGCGWVIYEGGPNFTQQGTTSDAVLDTQTVTPAGNPFTLTIPFASATYSASVAGTSAMSPYQALPSLAAGNPGTVTMEANPTPPADQTTATLPANATAAQVYAALSALQGVSTGPGAVVTGPDGGPFTIQFGITVSGYTTPLLHRQMPTMTATGGATVVHTAVGRNSTAELSLAMLYAANAAAGMGPVVSYYLQLADGAACSMFGYYSSTTAWGQYGAWGWKQNTDDTQCAKYPAVAGYASSPGAAIPLPPPPIYATAISLSATTLAALQTFTGTVTINAVQTTATSVPLSTNSPAYFATFPGSVTVPAGQTTAAFTAQVAAQVAAVSATITATLSSVSVSASATLVPFNPPFTLNPADPRASACIAYYPFFEGSGGTIHDCGPLGLHLQLTAGRAVGTDVSWVAGMGSGTSGPAQYGVLPTGTTNQLCFYTAVPTGTIPAMNFTALFGVKDAGLGGDRPIFQFANSSNNNCYAYKWNPATYLGQVADSGLTTTFRSAEISGQALGTWGQHAYSLGSSMTYNAAGHVASVALPAALTDSLVRFGIYGAGSSLGAPYGVTVSGLALFGRVLTTAEAALPLSNLIVPIAVPPPPPPPPPTTATTTVAARPRPYLPRRRPAARPRPGPH